MYIVMGHDTGPMMPLLSALQIWDGRWPSYASKIVFEMYENRLNGGSFAVRVIYDGQIMLVPGCSSTLCDWNEFDNVLQALLPPSHRSFELTTI
jgi:lysophosphatidic acid phosphatase type 6